LKGRCGRKYGGCGIPCGNKGIGIGPTAPESPYGDQSPYVTVGLHIVVYGNGRGIHADEFQGTRPTIGIIVPNLDLVVAGSQSRKTVVVGNGFPAMGGRPFDLGSGIRIPQPNCKIPTAGNSIDRIVDAATSSYITGSHSSR